MRKARILVIEDNLDNYDLVRFLLQQEGYDVMGAYDGRTGLTLARERKPDLILLDLSIPEISGWNLAAQIKANPETAHIRILALTGHTLPGDRKRALDAGCDGYISKPLDIPDFIEQIETSLAKRVSG
jgi:two-component system, cell cycle response regulator DivK